MTSGLTQGIVRHQPRHDVTLRMGFCLLTRFTLRFLATTPFATMTGIVSISACMSVL